MAYNVKRYDQDNWRKLYKMLFECRSRCMTIQDLKMHSDFPFINDSRVKKMFLVLFDVADMMVEEIDRYIDIQTKVQYNKI